jgi:disulfide bond formation protein DsbB/DNA-binding beta-propeller fold protein YncE
VKREPLYTALSLAVLALSIVPIGGAVFVLGFMFGDSPCVMCWEQRIGMTIVALLGVFILRYGPRPKYVGLAVLVSVWGMFMGLRHMSLHAARDIGQGFSIEVLGAHTYTWSLFIFAVCVVTMGVMLLALREADPAGAPRTLRPLDRVAVYVFLIVVAANVVQAFASTGPPPYLGQSDPIRFSFSPSHWVWSTEEWSPAPVSLRGRWGAEKPDLAAVRADPAGSPLANLTPLPVVERRSLGVPLRGTPTDLAYDAVTDRFLVTTQQGVYILDGSLGRVVRHTIVDPGFAVDLDAFAGAAFLDPTTVVAVSQNKSYVVLREHDGADAGRNFRFFLESFDQFDQVSRSRLGTVRARLMYTMSAAYDPETESLYTVTVPNSKTHRLVVSRFDRRDLTLSAEFMPALQADSGLALAAESRSLDELYVSAATVAGGRLYALSAAYGTLLAIDPIRQTVVAAYVIPGLSRPTGLAQRGDNLYVVCEDGALLVVGAPAA